MSERKEVGDFLSVHARPVFSPAASSVDTYVRPVAPPKSKGEALSNAIAQLDNAFTPALQKGIRQQATREHEKGEELFQKNRVDFAEAVRNGSIPMGASPFVRRGYRESQLHVLGATYNIELKRALEHSNLSEIDNPAEVEQFVQAFNEKFRAENNLQDMPQKEVNRIFTPMVVQANDGFRNQQAAENIQLVEERRFRAFEQELYLAVTQGRFTGPEGSASADAKNLSQWLNARAQEMYEEGIDYKLIEKSILKSVGEAALKNGSVGMAGILNNIEVAGMGSLGKSAAGRSVMGSVRKAAARKEAARHRAAAAAVGKEKKKNITRLQAEAQAAAREGDFERADELLSELNTIDPTKASVVDGFIRRYSGDAEDAEEDGVFASTLNGVYSASTMEEASEVIDEAIIHGGLSPEGANQLERIAKRRNRDEPSGDPLGIYEGDSYITGKAKNIKDHFPKTEFGQSNPEYADNVARATADFEDTMLLWLKSNMDEDGNYDRLKARKAAQEAQAAAIEAHKSPSDDETITDPEIPVWAE